MDRELKIGEFAKRAGVSLQTLRYYERIGLVKPDRRLPSGYRLYNDQSLFRIRFVKNAQDLGFALGEIKKLLGLKVRPNTKCSEIKKEAQKKLQSVEEKMKHLKAIQKALNDFVALCNEERPSGECPILKGLERNGYGY